MATIDEAQILAEDKFEYFKDICNVYKAIENCEDIEEIKKKASLKLSFCLGHAFVEYNNWTMDANINGLLAYYSSG